MTSDELDEGISLLRRAPVLKACRAAPQSRAALVEATGVSRTTVYRTTVALGERGLLEHTADGYRTTARGEALSNLAAMYFKGIDVIDHLEPLFKVVTHPKLLANAHLLTDATVTVVDPENPYRVAERSVERFERASNVRGVVASASSRDLLESALPIIETKERLEWLFSESALTAHDTVGGDTFRDALNANYVSIRVIPDDQVPFTFSVNRDDVSISGHDPTSGLPTVLVKSDALAAKRWLKSTFEALHETATPLETWLNTA